MISKRLSAADEESAAEALLEAALTDGLPVVVPTPERVERMVEAGGVDPATSLGAVPPINGEAVVEKIAVNAVMAGCRPEYFPVVLAATRAMLRPEFGLMTIQASTGPYGPMLVVNGPIRNELGIAGGVGCMGPGWHANVTIGRAIRLVLINIGGGRPGIGDAASQGSPVKLSFCFAEYEEMSPWTPYHTTRGFEASDNVVTVIAAEGTQALLMIPPEPGARGATPEGLINTIAARIVAPGGTAHYLARVPAATGTFTTVALTPQTARYVDALGWSRKALQEAVWERAVMPIRDRKVYATALADEPEEWELDPEWDDPDAVIRAYDSPADIQIVVAGDVHCNQIIPCGAFKVGAPCSERISLPR
ncbi:MAG TPA: hypothetical protein VJT49_18290 [Amycolatopsis sp.]|uniref:hypothetical protein n=1 Tax=Amycolatopsis sp. TaxID=37632 RepID=UPI002B476434|nr:hypothetical protein [Amycolatopsis sp.]HKS47020.1 hypothetical protein [Amycolatopsis sp.]